MEHQHVIIDSDKHFIIDPVTRTIRPEIPEKKKIMQYDHNSERYTFEIPRMVEGHDMSESDVIQINYINISTNKRQSNSDVYEISDAVVQEKDGEEVLVFSWLISENATQYAGSLEFAACFKCFDEDVIEYAWHTDIHSSITVVGSINNSPIVAGEYSDILEEWRQRLFVEPNNMKDRIIAEIEEKRDQALADISSLLATLTDD